MNTSFLQCEEKYKRVDGRELFLHFFRPQKARNGAPALLLLHGGGWERESPAILFRHAQFFASRGFFVFLPEYRLMPAGGELMCCLEDSVDAAIYVRKNAVRFGFCQKNLYALGESAGAYLACCLGCAKILRRVRPEISSSLVSKVADVNGIVDLTGYWKYAFGGAAPAEEAEKFSAHLRRQLEYSPLYNVSEGDACVLLLHGTADSVVDPADSARYAYALQRRGIRAETVFLEGKNHAFLLYGFGLDDGEIGRLLERIERFFAAEPQVVEEQ